MIGEGQASRSDRRGSTSGCVDGIKGHPIVDGEQAAVRGPEYFKAYSCASDRGQIAGMRIHLIQCSADGIRVQRASQLAEADAASVAELSERSAAKVQRAELATAEQRVGQAALTRLDAPAVRE